MTHFTAAVSICVARKPGGFVRAIPSNPVSLPAERKSSFLGDLSPLSGSNSLVGEKRPVEAPWKLISMRRRLCALPCWMVFGIRDIQG